MVNKEQNAEWRTVKKEKTEPVATYWLKLNFQLSNNQQGNIFFHNITFSCHVQWTHSKGQQK